MITPVRDKDSGSMICCGPEGNCPAANDYCVYSNGEVCMIYYRIMEKTMMYATPDKILMLLEFEHLVATGQIEDLKKETN